MKITVNPEKTFKIHYGFEDDSKYCVSKKSFGIKTYLYPKVKTDPLKLPVKLFHCLTTILKTFPRFNIFPPILILLILLSSQIKISEAFNNKIKYITKIEKYGNSLSLRFPTDVYVDYRGDIYILDNSLQMILIFNKEYIPISRIDKTNGLSMPKCLAVDRKGLIYVGHEVSKKEYKGCITVFDSLGHIRKKITFSGGPWAKSFVPVHIEIDNTGNLYVAGGQNGIILMLSSNGNFINMIKLEKKNEILDAVCVSVQGDSLFILSEWAGKVFHYKKVKGKDNTNDFTFRLEKTFGQKGGSTGKLSRAQGLALDTERDICYIIDYMRHTLLMYNPSTGGFIKEFGGLGWGPGWFQFPKGVCVDNDGKIYVVDTFNNRIQVFKNDF